MRLRDPFDDTKERESGEPEGGTNGDEDLTRVRLEGERFLAAADEAISRALSGDSEQFLAANRQQGGQ